jgi:transaldolase
VLGQNLPAEEKAEALMRIAVVKAAEKLIPQYESSAKRMGYVCAQVNPVRAGDRPAMMAMARRLNKWAPNISVKLPCTLAGLDVLEDCIAEGIGVTSTVSFTVPQALAIAERHRKGIARAKANGIEPGKCFAVIMIGRLDDFLREVALDNRAPVSEADIRQSGLAATKRAYKIYKQKGYEAVLLVAALRGPYHLTELAGAELVMSIAPGAQPWFVDQDHPREARIDRDVPADVIDRLRQMPEFVRAYEPDGMQSEEFVSFGATQRTLAQFCDVGWRLLENIK